MYCPLVDVCGYDFKCINFKQYFGTDILSIQLRNTLELMADVLSKGKSALVPITAWRRHAPSHCPKQR